eukprot:CAMPEP_0204513948 /NCGR_PEP_ID=MMETSP0661-20131031/1780_1 /ASSEMBLY_ACC=CAM_ASM_000606 /TAXON_ID=109239 /ORGANISM="Alexandrium margalefi, Strain AMGDE01CS-322" /LENGTH=91 /DNA_ID=CAMNT_0051519145 /DNA_START=228 /DNA_END=500 /DNA_ORIENTATION=-
MPPWGWPADRGSRKPNSTPEQHQPTRRTVRAASTQAALPRNRPVLRGTLEHLVALGRLVYEPNPGQVDVHHKLLGGNAHGDLRKLLHGHLD